MLETIREFARERLNQSGEEDELRRAQADRLIELADRAGTRAIVDQPRPWNFDLVAPEIDNVRAVLEWALDRDPPRGLRLASWLEAFWVVRDAVEGAGWLERLLAETPDADPGLRAMALRALGGTSDMVQTHVDLDASTGGFAEVENFELIEGSSATDLFGNAKNSVITGNTTTGNGGGASFVFGALTLKNCVVSGNRADAYPGRPAGQLFGGGGLRGAGSPNVMTVIDSEITGNSSGRQGGGIFSLSPVGSPGTLIVKNSIVENNTATADPFGGGIYSNNTTLTLKDSKIAGNTPDDIAIAP